MGLEELKNNYKKMQEEQKKQDYEFIAKTIVGFKLMKHVVYHLPNAIEAKKMNDLMSNKKSSVIDYIEMPEYDYDEDVKEVINKLERKEEKLKELSDKIIKVRMKFSPIYWVTRIIKKIAEKIKKNNVKALPNAEENECVLENNIPSNVETENEFLESLKVKDIETKENAKYFNHSRDRKQILENNKTVEERLS